MDGCAAHTSMVIHISREKANVDSHTHICDAYVHSGQREILLRVSSQNQNRKPLKDCLTLYAEAQKAGATPGDSDTHTCFYKTEPDLKAISTVVYTQKLSQNCIQAHIHSSNILPHINLYFSERQKCATHSPGHRTNSFF